jgi:hypothetical protein
VGGGAGPATAADRGGAAGGEGGVAAAGEKEGEEGERGAARGRRKMKNRTTTMGRGLTGGDTGAEAKRKNAD